MVDWSFLTNHARALIFIALDPGARLIDVAAALGVTERNAYAIVKDLATDGYVLKTKDGRRNRYTVHTHMPVPGSLTRSATIGEVLDVLIGNNQDRSKVPGKHTGEPSPE